MEEPSGEGAPRAPAAPRGRRTAAAAEEKRLRRREDARRAEEWARRRAARRREEASASAAEARARARVPAASAAAGEGGSSSAEGGRNRKKAEMDEARRRAGEWAARRAARRAKNRGGGGVASSEPVGEQEAAGGEADNDIASVADIDRIATEHSEGGERRGAETGNEAGKTGSIRRSSFFYRAVFCAVVSAVLCFGLPARINDISALNARPDEVVAPGLDPETPVALTDETGELEDEDGGFEGDE